MTDLSVVPDIIKSGETAVVEIIKAIGDNEIINGIGTLMGISGFSLRDIIGKEQIKKIFYKIKDCFKDKKATEEQQKIIKDSFLELEDYIKNCEEFNENVFEKISELLINGINNADILTREYIKILKKLSWIDLLVLMDMNSVEEIRTVDRFRYVEDMQQKYLAIFTNKHRDIPYELVQKSFKKLKELDFINNNGILYKEVLSNLTTVNKIHLRSSLGDKIVNLINGNIEENNKGI